MRMPVVRLDQNGLSSARSRSDRIIPVILVMRRGAVGRVATARFNAMPPSEARRLRCDCGMLKPLQTAYASRIGSQDDDHRLSPGDLALRAHCLADGGARSSVRPAGLSARDHRRSSAPVEGNPRSRQGAGDPRRRHRPRRVRRDRRLYRPSPRGGRLALAARTIPAYARYVYWLHFAEGSLMSLLLIALVLSRVQGGQQRVRSPREYATRMKQMLHLRRHRARPTAPGSPATNSPLPT